MITHYKHKDSFWALFIFNNLFHWPGNCHLICRQMTFQAKTTSSSYPRMQRYTIVWLKRTPVEITWKDKRIPPYMMFSWWCCVYEIDGWPFKSVVKMCISDYTDNHAERTEPAAGAEQSSEEKGHRDPESAVEGFGGNRRNHWYQRREDCKPALLLSSIPSLIMARFWASGVCVYSPKYPVLSMVSCICCVLDHIWMNEWKADWMTK